MPLWISMDVTKAAHDLRVNTSSGDYSDHEAVEDLHGKDVEKALLKREAVGHLWVMFEGVGVVFVCLRRKE